MRYNYRLRLFRDLVRIAAVPSVSLYIIANVADIHFGLLAFPAYLAFAAVWAYAVALYTDLAQDREAGRLGARQIPRVVGKWPGNIDVLLQLLEASPKSYISMFQLALFEKYQSTTINLRLLWQDWIISMDSEHQKYVLTTGFNHFHKGVGPKERMEKFLGDGIFNRDDDLWKAHRAIARPFFARDRISDFGLFERYTSATLSLIFSITSSGQPVEVQDIFARFTLDASSEFLFGTNMDTLSGKLPIPGKTKMSPMGSATDDEFGGFSSAFETLQAIVSKRIKRGKLLWPIAELLHDSMTPHVKVIHEYVDPLVQRALENRRSMEKAGVQSSPEQSTFLEYLAGNTEDPSVIRDQLLNILIAARDTTAQLLTYIVYFLATQPEIAKKLRTEVLGHCGADGPPTVEAIKAMKYMRAVIHETLRLFPPVPANARESRSTACLLPKADGTYPSMPDSLYMPPETSFTYYPILMQRNPALWGPDADIFDPERWLDERAARYTSNPMIYVPFSAGPRICIGQNYAYNEASCFLTRMLQQFDSFTLAPEVQPEGSLPLPEWKSGKGRQTFEKLWPSNTLTLYVKGGLWVHFHRA
ncbi:Cytochrome P450 52E2 [Sparassis crispa]|uniref:Cytochrome P450 52E2 n=1 Tax=Sparassis crispa TaxID=139825 RepID=A0A401GTS4_9APHY|nr:Cytochrome P450 52E2 [Sparassis crispa]GBE85606.1 Cytochrome P450 52E2 [Sparassis crispa]